MLTTFTGRLSRRWCRR